MFNGSNNLMGVYIPASVTMSGKIIGNKLPFTYDFEIAAIPPEWGTSWYYTGQVINLGVLPPY